MLSSDPRIKYAVLFLCETEGQRAFDGLRRNAGSAVEARDDGHWTVASTSEIVSLVFNDKQARPIIVVRGQQIITSENLEVLAIGSENSISNGLSLGNTLDEARSANCQIILPWGVGKWFGARGKLVDGVIERLDYPGLHIGDNAGRPWFWPVPRFRRAHSRGIKVLCGSDPLPFDGDECRMGEYVSVFDGAIDLETPWNSIVNLLDDADVIPETSGTLMGVRDFAMSQISLRTRRLA